MADACQRMLLDTDAGQKLAEFGAQSRDNRSIVRNLKKWVAEFMDRMRKIFRNVESDTLAAKEFNRFDQNTKQILADMFVDMSMDAGEKLSTIKEAGMTEKITTGEGGVRNQGREKKTYEDKYYKRLIDNWDGEDHGGSFRVGRPSGALLDVGVPDVDIWFDQSKASKQLKGKVEIDKDALKRIPEILEKPIAIAESYDNTVVVFGEMYDEHRHPIVIALRVNSTNRRNHITVVNKIRSIGTRTSNLDKLLDDNAILYLNENKKETNHWFNALGRSTPFGGTKFGLIRSISFDLPSVKNNNSAEKKASARTEDSVSDRAMLVDLFEQMVTSSNEHKALENYRKNIDKMIAIEEQVDRLGAEIRKVSFAEGPRDMEYLNKLRLLQKKAINRLNIYDNKLLGLEKSGVLKGLIDRYRKQITQESFDRAKSYYQERNERRENEIRQYYRESRRQAVERHDMAEIRQRIRKDVQRLDSLLGFCLFININYFAISTGNLD